MRRLLLSMGLALSTAALVISGAFLLFVELWIGVSAPVLTAQTEHTVYAHVASRYPAPTLPAIAHDPTPTATPKPALPVIDLADFYAQLEDIAFYNVVGCGDGTFLIGLNFTNDIEYTYFIYEPPLTERGTPLLFTRLYWSDTYDVSMNEGVVHLSIPMRANEYEDYRFLFETDIIEGKEHNWLSNRTFTLLDPTDIAINAQSANITKDVPIPIGQMAQYHGVYSDDIWDDQLKDAPGVSAAALRTAAYGGDASALLRLYVMCEGGEDVGADRHALQLAAMKFTDETDMFKDLSRNPLLGYIAYGEGVQSFPAGRALEEAANAVRHYDEFVFRDTDTIPYNTDVERLEALSNYDDFFRGRDYFSLGTWGEWELDFDGDGRDELIYFYPGGTMGNEFWSFVHLDDDGLIASVESGEHMRSMSMHMMDNRYYYLNWAYDYNDKQSLGLNLFAMDRNGDLWEAHVYREATGLRTVFSDLYDESVKPLYDTLSDDLFTYLQLYKAYTVGDVFGTTFEPDEGVMKLFKEAGFGRFAFTSMDADNDGAGEVVGEWVYLPESAHLEYEYGMSSCGIGANHTVDIGKMLTGQEWPLRIFPIAHGGKNHFLSMQAFGDSQYIFKLHELSNGTPYLLAAWVATTEDRVSVTVELYDDVQDGLYSG